MIIVETLTVITVSMILPLVWLMYFSDTSFIKHNERMEKLNIDHARDMRRLHLLSANLFQDDNRFIITYLVPTPRQPKWARLSNRIRIYPYTFQYAIGDIDEGPPSKYTKTISKNKWFYMQLKNWSETENRESAVNAMEYLQWERDIP